MDQKLIEFNKSLRTKKMPDVRVGDILRIHKKIKEGDKERIQVFKGLVIAIKGRQSSSPTITVRRESQGIGVEMTVPVYLPTIDKIEVLRHSKVRRSKLYYMRERSGKSAKMKAMELTEKEKEDVAPIKKDLTDKKSSSEKTSTEKKRKSPMAEKVSGIKALKGEKKEVKEKVEEKKE